MIGDESEVQTFFGEKLRKLSTLHDSIAEIGDPAVELALGRCCADVSRVTHLLRSSGDFLKGNAAEEHDKLQKRF